MPSSDTFAELPQPPLSSKPAYLKELSHLLSFRRKSPKQYWRSIRISQRLIKKAKIDEVTNSEDLRPHANVSINGSVVYGQLDSGAGISCLGKNVYHTLSKCNLKWKEHSGSSVQIASGQSQIIEGYADNIIEFMGKANKIRLYIIPSLQNELFLGVDFWIAFDSQNLKSYRLLVPKPKRKKIHGTCTN